MATMVELADSYRETAEQIRAAIRRLEEKKKELGPVGRSVAEHDLRLMRQMLRDTREIEEVLRHYYDRGYYINHKYTC